MKKGEIKVKFKKIFSIILSILLTLVVIGCASEPAPENEDPTNETSGDKGSIILSTTTSTENSGLLDFILPDFTEKTGIEVKVVAVGTGKALQMGIDGEADVLLVHAKASEEEFVANGHGLERFDVMYNDFVLIGPENDPGNLSEIAKGDIVSAFKIINENQLKFISRGDDSGTHKKELAFWKDAGIEPSGDWYISTGKGMGDVIQMADEMLGYTLADRATYLSMMNNIGLKVVVEGDSKMFNQYGVIAVNPDKNDKINSEGAQEFINWLLSGETQALIGEFGKEEFEQSLFVPNAK